MKYLKSIVTKNQQPAKYIVDQKTGFRFEIIDEKAEHGIFKVAQNNVTRMAKSNGKSQRKKILLSAIIMIAIISMILVVISLNKPRVVHVKTPNVVNLLLKDAIKKLNKSGFEVVVIKVEDNLQEEELVIGQSIQAEEVVEKGHKITITAIEKIESGTFSSWVAELPYFVKGDTYLAEEQIQYRFRIKKTLASLKPLNSNDWLFVGEGNEYSPWSAWSITPVDKSPTLEVDELMINDTHNIYFRWRYLNNENKTMYTWLPNLAKDMVDGSLEKESKTLINDSLSVIRDICMNPDETTPCPYSKQISEYTEQWYLETTIIINDPLKTHLEYRSRTITPLYLYQKRSLWSTWQERIVEKDSLTDVETRTVYRYKAK